jgi:gamma-glutamyl-gamma-aminobutyrate hydrolase PuuD
MLQYLKNYFGGKKMPNKILVVGSKSYASAVRGLGDITFNIAAFVRDPSKFKLVLFTGGEDVSPEFYGHSSPKEMCYSNIKRDLAEEKIFNIALSAGIKMTGICRGAQFMNVMSGGAMMHHIAKHGSLGGHTFESSKNNKIIKVNSLHHQMIVPSEDGLVIGWSKDKLSDIYVWDEDKLVNWSGPEVEAILYPKTLCCGVQYHPEMLSPHSGGYKFYHDLVKDFLVMDIEKFTDKYTKEGKIRCTNKHLTRRIYHGKQ